VPSPFDKLRAGSAGLLRCGKVQSAMPAGGRGCVQPTLRHTHLFAVELGRSSKWGTREGWDTHFRDRQGLEVHFQRLDPSVFVVVLLVFVVIIIVVVVLI
jgi:hypothetical protein